MELRKEVASQQYALDNCQDDMNHLCKIKEAWENGFDTAKQYYENKYEQLKIKYGM